MERTTIPALTIWQPWASAIVLGHKRVENRTWSSSHRGPLAIHAGLRIDPDGADVLADVGVILPLRCEDLPRGAILGYVDLVDVVRYPSGGDGREAQGRLLDAPDPYGLMLDRLAMGPWCWILRNPRVLPQPVEVKGHQGLWDCDLETG